MSIDEVVERKLRECNAIYLRDQTTREDVWYYFIIYSKECDAIWMDYLYGFHFYQINNNGTRTDVYGINLKSCYENGYYSIKCLIDTVIHELLHKETPNEYHVYNAVSQLLKGYKFSKIKI